MTKLNNILSNNLPIIIGTIIAISVLTSCSEVEVIEPVTPVPTDIPTPVDTVLYY